MHPATIGPYKIERELGRGGMGEVYLATDTRLDRQVAIKALPAHLAQDADRLARFQREAKVLASLNHPGIGAIYGLEESGGHRYLVLEFVEGQTLSDRLAKGPIPIEEALALAKQIAEALEVAHEKGVIHRDLKPANVMLTDEGAAKVLDFGLARTEDGTPSSSVAYNGPDSPTRTSPARLAHSPTIPGVIMGTAGYMSPEQARGKPVDKRSDIFSFGCVLYEMLTGAMPFRGETVADSIGATLHKDMDLGLLPPATPRRVRELLANCLAKDRKNRLHDIADARIELDRAMADPHPVELGDGASRDTLRRAIPWAMCAALLAVLVTALAFMWASPRPAPSAVMRLTMTIPEGQYLANSPGPRMDISSDGSCVVFVGLSETGVRQLHLRCLDQTEATPLANTEDAFSPFFSPDGQWIAFGQLGKLRKVSILGGPATLICDAMDLRGGTWASDGTIVFSPDPDSGLWRVPAVGGEPVKLTDAGRGEASPTHRWPHFLPDGKTVLFTASDRNSEYTEATINTLTLDTGEQKVVVKGGTSPRYVASGHIVYGRGSALMAVPFDVRKLEATGAPIPILEGVQQSNTFGDVQFTCAQTGVMVYIPDSGAGEDRNLIWIDHEGNETPASSHKRPFFDASLSPDGTRIAAQITIAGNTDIWILELARDSLIRLTFDAGQDIGPRWSPDGKTIAFTSNRANSNRNLYSQSADGTGEAQRLSTSVNGQRPLGFSPDSSILFFNERFAKTTWDILYLRLNEPDAKPEVFLSTTFDESAASLSPDGKWLAYHSNESGEYEVYVRPFLRPGPKIKVSSGRSGVPMWSPDGKVLYYRSRDNRMAVPITVQDDSLEVGTPRLVFTLKGNAHNGPLGISTDGTRFLYIRPASEAATQAQQPVVVVNWFDELKTKVQAGK